MLKQIYYYSFTLVLQSIIILQIVGQGDYCEQLNVALTQLNQANYDNNFQFHFCEYVEDILRVENSPVVPDYITILMDPTNGACIKIVSYVYIIIVNYIYRNEFLFNI